MDCLNPETDLLPHSSVKIALVWVSDLQKEFQTICYLHNFNIIFHASPVEPKWEHLQGGHILFLPVGLTYTVGTTVS